MYSRNQSQAPLPRHRNPRPFDLADSKPLQKSSDNIPIEALWSYFLKYTGHDSMAAILLGKTENYMNVANELHIDLFHWLWSRIVQNAVNQFRSNKYLPSGVAPEEVFQHPENFGLRHAGIPVDLNVGSPGPRFDCGLSMRTGTKFEKYSTTQFAGG
ncbi:hypothetical protein B0H13DRAFT_1851916 [Mycena leptocephala]|nr:hypothetical protein B0H13DRAFT_1851916 [Mycena leptocephala]